MAEFAVNMSHVLIHEGENLFKSCQVCSYVCLIESLIFHIWNIEEYDCIFKGNNFSTENIGNRCD